MKMIDSILIHAMMLAATNFLLKCSRGGIYATEFS